MTQVSLLMGAHMWTKLVSVLNTYLADGCPRSGKAPRRGVKAPPHLTVLTSPPPSKNKNNKNKKLTTNKTKQKQHNITKQKTHKQQKQTSTKKHTTNNKYLAPTTPKWPYHRHLAIRPLSSYISASLERIT